MNKSKGKHNKKRKKNKKRLPQVIFFVILIVSIAYLIYYWWQSQQEVKDKQELQEQMNNIVLVENNNTKKTDKQLQLEELKKTNSDVVGWLKIEGTNIDYPILQTNNNQYYLTHNYKKEYSKSGSLFLDKDFDFTLPSTNYLIYGHRNTNGMMFEDLIQYKKEEYYKQHPIIQLTTLEEDCQYEIIAVFLSRVYYKNETNVFRYYYFVNAKNEEEFSNYISESKKASLYHIDKTAKYGDQLLTLSTCEYSQEDGRLAIVAKKIIK